MLRVYKFEFTQRPDWAVSPEESDEGEVTSSSGTLAAEGAQREVSSVLLGLRQFTPQEVAVEAASAIRLLHRVHVNLQQFDNLSLCVTCHDTGYVASKSQHCQTVSVVLINYIKFILNSYTPVMELYI